MQKYNNAPNLENTMTAFADYSTERNDDNTKTNCFFKQLNELWAGTHVTSRPVRSEATEVPEDMFHNRFWADTVLTWSPSFPSSLPLHAIVPSGYTVYSNHPHYDQA